MVEYARLWPRRTWAIKGCISDEHARIADAEGCDGIVRHVPSVSCHCTGGPRRAGELPARVRV